MILSGSYLRISPITSVAYFFRLAQNRRDQMVEQGRKPVLLYFNLIGMKHYNRQYGFEAGDRLICAVADVLSRHYGEQSIGRLSEDHFAAIADEEHLEESLGALFRECQELNGKKPSPFGWACTRTGRRT